MLDEFRSTSITWDKATRRIYSPISANESDSNGRKLNIQVVNSGQVENLTGATLHLYWETKDKAQHGLDAFTASDISKGEFEIFYTTGMLSNVGELNATLVLVDTTGKVVSDWFKITVARGIDNDAVQSENSFTTLTQALIDISNLEQNYTPRLNDLTAQLQQTEQEFSSQLAQKASKTYVDQVTQSIATGSPKGTYATVSALTTALPTGNTNIYVVSADGKWYYWNETAWTAGGVYQATALGDGSVTRPKIGTTLTKELDSSIEDNLSNVFELNNKSFLQSGQDLTYYNDVFGAVKEITLIGFNPSNQHRLRLFARNHPTFNYRFIICHRAKDGDIWADVFDSGGTFTVTENTNGITTISRTVGSMTVKMKIDYSQIPLGSSNSDGALASADGRYKLNSNCFYENKVEKVTSDVSALKNILNQKMFATKSGKSFKFKYRYDENIVEVFEFNELGVNKIIHPKNIYRETNPQLTSDFMSPTSYYTLATDWISPYSNVKALTGTLTDFVGTVGGNHGTNGAGGFPTARNVSANLFVNGVEVTDGEISECDKAVLIVKNYVSAMNKIDSTTGVKADSFEEIVTYTITPNNIEVSVYLTALEDIEIGGYAGLQMTTNMFSGQAYFTDSANKFAPDGTNRNSLSLPFKNDRMVYGDANNVIVTYTNREVGLGDLSAKGSAPVYQLSIFNKLYAHLITNPVTVPTGDSIFYSGGYTFMRPLVCAGAEKAYFIKYNGVTEYCVDFLSSVSNTYLELGFQHLGKQIDVIEKSDSITCDNLISGKGLKITATGFGTLKFRIKPV